MMSGYIVLGPVTAKGEAEQSVVLVVWFLMMIHHFMVSFPRYRADTESNTYLVESQTHLRPHFRL